MITSLKAVPQEEHNVKLTALVLQTQDPSKPVFKADSDFVPLLLTFVANRSNQEVAMVCGAQKVYKDRNMPKGYAHRLLRSPYLTCPADAIVHIDN